MTITSKLGARGWGLGVRDWNELEAAGMESVILKNFLNV
jgi:predicted TIM-barrel enzyme